MRIIGVTGGMGAGKSMVLKYLEERWGARCLQLDAVSRALIGKDGRCVEAVAALLGDEVRAADGSLSRPLIAQKVFGDKDLLEALEAILHPAVKDEVLAAAEEYKRSGTELLVLEAALLIEEHYDAICDEMWYIYADADTRYRRLKSDRGYSDLRIRDTFKSQLSDAEFRAHADFVLDNSGDFAETCSQIDRHMQDIAGRTKGSK